MHLLRHIAHDTCIGEPVVELVVEVEAEPVPARQDAMSEASDAAISSFPTMDMDLTQPPMHELEPATSQAIL